MFYFFFHSKSAKPSVYFQHISVQAGRIFKCSTAACDCCYRHGKRRSRLRQSWLRGCSDFRAREDGGLKEGDEQQELTGERIWRKNPQGLVTGCPGSDRLLSPSGQFSVLVFPDTAAAFKVVEHFPLATVPLLDFKHTALSHFSFCLAGSFSVLLFLPHLSAL